MKIAHVVWSMLTGGIETMLVNIINEQVKTEEVTLYIINDIWYEPLLQQLSPRCIIKKCNRKTSSRNPWPLIKFNYWLWKQRPNIVHVHSDKLSDIILDRRHIVRTIHSNLNDCREYPRMKALFAISNSVRKTTLEQGYESLVIENGIHCSCFVHKQKEKNTQMFQLVQVGRLNISLKGQDILIRAVEELVHHRGIRNFHVTFIGEGDSRKELEQMTIKKNISQYISFIGRKSQSWLYEHLSDFDCFVQPSRLEGFGLTIAEAMAAKIPVLVSDIEGPMEVIDHGKVGMFFRNGDVKDLTNKLVIILNGRYDSSLIDKAYQRTISKYDVISTAKRYIEEYKKLA